MLCFIYRNTKDGFACCFLARASEEDIEENYKIAIGRNWFSFSFFLLLIRNQTASAPVKKE